MATGVFEISGSESKLFKTIPMTLPFAFRINRNGGMRIGEQQQLVLTEEPQPPPTIDEYRLLLDRTTVAQGTQKYAEILRALYDHDDWKQLHQFFKIRHKNTGLFAKGPKVVKKYDTSSTFRMPVEISTYKCGLPADFLKMLEEAADLSLKNVMGDPFPSAIGPSIGYCYGFEIMDILYEGKDTKGRTWKDWVDMITAIETWVRQIESTKAAFDSHAYSWKNVPPELDKDPRVRMRPEYILTNVIRGVMGLKWVFESIAKEPFKFRGFEDSLITNFVNRAVGDNIYARFGNTNDFETYTYDEARKAPPCPKTNKHQDWINWINSIPDGRIIVPKDVFEARWAALCVMAFTRKTFDLKGKKEAWDQYPSKENFLFM